MHGPARRDARGGGEARGLPMTPAEAHLAHTGGGGDSHLPPRSRRSPRRHHPLLPPPRPRAARTSSPDGGTGTAAGGTHAETAWGASLTDSAASVPPTHTRVLTTSRWQPAPQPADTPPPLPSHHAPHGGLARPHTHLHFPAPPPKRHLPPGVGTTTSAPLGRVGRPPAGREGGRATGKEGGGTGEGAGGARDSRETRKGRGEGGWSRGPVGHHLHLGGRRAKNTDPAIRNPQPRNPGRREAPTRGRLIVKRRSDRRSPGRNPGPQVRSKCR